MNFTQKKNINYKINIYKNIPEGRPNIAVVKCGKLKNVSPRIIHVAFVNDCRDEVPRKSNIRGGKKNWNPNVKIKLRIKDVNIYIYLDRGHQFSCFCTSIYILQKQEN